MGPKAHLPCLHWGSARGPTGRLRGPVGVYGPAGRVQDEYSSGYFLDRYTDLLETIQTGDLDEARDQLAELEPLQAWLALEHVDRRQVNRRLTLYALGDEAWRWE
jgi:hypothetical protein